MTHIHPTMSVKDMRNLVGHTITLFARMGAVSAKNNPQIDINRSTLDSSLINKHPSLQRSEKREYNQIYGTQEAVVIANVSSVLHIPLGSVDHSWTLEKLLNFARSKPEYGPYEKQGAAPYSDEDVIMESVEIRVIGSGEKDVFLDVRVMSQVEREIIGR